MNYSGSTYRSKIYRDFRAIEATEWGTVVRFYEGAEAQIRELEFDEYFEMLNAYTNALFEVGNYRKHLLMADAVVEASVMQNVKFFKGMDVFHHTLFRKAASYYHCHELDRADYVLRELLRIDPYDADATQFLKKCLRRMRPAIVRRTRAAAMLFFLLSALVICVEMLVVRSFYPHLTGQVELGRNIIFGLGLAVLIGGDLLHRGQAEREVQDFVGRLRRRRK